MANWTGTYTITTPGTTATSGTTTTMTNTGASFPGSNGLANMTIRFLTGSNAGTTSVITSNTTTQCTFGAVSNAVVAGDTYEIVVILKNNDHFTASTTFSTNIIVEAASSASLLIDGNFSITFTNSCITRLNFASSTMISFSANNRTVSGKGSSWPGITFATALTGSTSFSYVKIQDTSTAVFVLPSTGVGDATGIHHIWSEDSNTNGPTFGAGTQTVSMTLASIFTNKSYTMSPIFNTTSNANSQTYSMCWFGFSTASGILWKGSGVQTQLVKNSVFQNIALSGAAVLTSSQKTTMQDSYASSSNQISIMGGSSSSAAGTYEMRRCVLDSCAALIGTASSTATLISNFNDVSASTQGNTQYTNFAASSYTAATSDNDYISGQNAAAYENVDTSTGVSTSTATPNQFKNLSANRTNAKAVRNRPYVMDNASVGTPTDKQVVITFDCQNGSVSGQGSSTVTTDSNSGQAVLSTTTTTGFEVNETIEIGYGTARAETAVISSISANTSLTLTTNLAFTHTSAQADTIKKRLRHIALPFIRYGTATGDYTMSSAVPDRQDWGLIYTGILTTENTETYAWNQTGHSITLKNLYPSTTYYAMPYAYDPLGNLLTGTEQTFTTAADTRYSDPGIDNVRSTTTYTYNNASQTGDMVVPTAGSVKTGVAFGSNSSLTGTYSADGSLIAGGLIRR